MNSMSHMYVIRKLFFMGVVFISQLKWLEFHMKLYSQNLCTWFFCFAIFFLIFLNFVPIHTLFLNKKIIILTNLNTFKNIDPTVSTDTIFVLLTFFTLIYAYVSSSLPTVFFSFRKHCVYSKLEFELFIFFVSDFAN